MEREMSSRLATVILFATILWTVGCASTTGSHRTLNPPVPGTMERYSELGVTVDAAGGVTLSSADKERLRDLIMRSIDDGSTGRFKLIHDLNANGGGVEAQVLIKRYDEGNAFARAMLAGLGAMHIDAEVTLVDRKSQDAVARHEVTKTFAWGGAYGGGTTIRDIEEGFAKAVAAAINGERTSD
jgi:hypothetical protein